jgi:5-methylcytosine-specific restriction endonuclease McrA
MDNETTLKDKILELRSQGLSYNKIVEQLGCAKSTVAYYCNNTSKDKFKTSQNRRRKADPLKRKIEHQRISKTNPIRSKIKNFMRAADYRQGNKIMEPVTFSSKNLLEKCGSTCYLTGDTIDFGDTASYSLDHRVPRSKGGLNTLENCEFATKAANFAKGDLSLEEFFELCVKVVKHNKLKID